MAHKTYIRNIPGTDTVVMFIHGFQGSTEHFERFIAMLDGNISVYNVLLKGHGKGVRDFAEASMAEWKEQIREIIDTLAAKYEKIYIVAHSMGTFFAMESAIHYPNIVKGIFLLQTPLKIGVKPAAVLNATRSFLCTSDDNKIVSAYKKAHGVKLNLRFWEYIGWIPRYIELFKESKRARNTIMQISVPCMIFQSAKDELVSVKSIRFIPQKENISLTILEKSAHFIYDEYDFCCLENMLCKMIYKNT